MVNKTVLKFQHTSLQHSDTPAQQKQDIRDLFEQGKKFPIKTGTEAGLDRKNNNMNRPHLKTYAKKHKHRISFWRDNWIAVDKDIIKKGTYLTGGVEVADSGETVGPGHDSGFAWVTFTHKDPRVGDIAIAATHYPTKGKVKGDPNYDINVRMAAHIARWAKQEGKGKTIVFVCGDFNMPDNKSDWFFDQPLTSAWDETGTYMGTGHGVIDGMASYDKDKRVSAKWIKALNDKRMFQHSDHYVVRAAYNVEYLPE